MNLSYKNYGIVFFLSSILMNFYSCSPKKALVGNDQDKHGCIASAGYKWSEVLNDCVRPWEVGERFGTNDQSVIVVFSKDSSIAEIFSKEKKTILCKKKKGEQRWTSPQKDVEISVEGENTIINYKGIKLEKE